MRTWVALACLLVLRGASDGAVSVDPVTDVALGAGEPLVLEGDFRDLSQRSIRLDARGERGRRVRFRVREAAPVR